MFLIYGKRKARINKYTNNSNYCKACNAFDLNVNVYKEYFHVFFIPIFPIGDKTARIYCNSCGEPYRIESVQREYEESTKIPIYLYSGTIIIAGLIAFLLFVNTRTQKEKAMFVENPKVGDVYLIRKDETGPTSYYFLRVKEIRKDTVRVYHNNLVYKSFVTNLNDEDFFDVREELSFTKKELKQMLDKDEITSVERDYGRSEGFNRLK
ncbi:MAG: zinc-ribbon domain-containing protein [Agriterribacter sp.]